jgi:hypothetical protein
VLLSSASPAAYQKVHAARVHVNPGSGHRGDLAWIVRRLTETNFGL